MRKLPRAFLFGWLVSVLVSLISMGFLIDSRQRIVVAGTSYDAADVDSTLKELGESVSSSDTISVPELQKKLLNLKTPFGKLFSEIVQGRSDVVAKADLRAKFERLDDLLTPGNLASAEERKRLLQNVAALDTSLTGYQRDLADLYARWTDKFWDSNQKDPLADTRKMDTKECYAIRASLRSIKAFIEACERNPPIVGNGNAWMWPEENLQEMQPFLKDIIAKQEVFDELEVERKNLVKKYLQVINKGDQ